MPKLAAVFTIAVALVSALFVISAEAAEKSANAAATGRYEVFSTTMLSSGQQVPVTLLVDTKTGRSWILSLNERALPLWLAIPLYSNMEPYSGDKLLRPSPN